MLGAWVGLIGDGEVCDRLLVWHTVKRLARKPLKQLLAKNRSTTRAAALSLALPLFQSVPPTCFNRCHPPIDRNRPIRWKSMAESVMPQEDATIASLQSVPPTD